jgi:hypothetical protein
VRGAVPAKSLLKHLPGEDARVKLRGLLASHHLREHLECAAAADLRRIGSRNSALRRAGAGRKHRHRSGKTCSR